MLTRIYRENQSLAEEGISQNDLTQISQRYLEGALDDKIGVDAKQRANSNYYKGQKIGHREYLCQKQGITLPEEF